MDWLKKLFGYVPHGTLAVGDCFRFKGDVFIIRPAGDMRLGGMLSYFKQGGTKYFPPDVLVKKIRRGAFDNHVIKDPVWRAFNQPGIKAQRMAFIEEN